SLGRLELPGGNGNHVDRDGRSRDRIAERLSAGIGRLVGAEGEDRDDEDEGAGCVTAQTKLQFCSGLRSPMEIPPKTLVVVLLALLGGCVSAPPQRYEYVQLLMGVQVRLVVYSRDEASGRNAAKAGFERVAQLENVMSDYLT